MELKGSKTEKNLLAAFAGESQASVKYSLYQSQAKKDGYEQYAAIFGETSHNEHEHAEIWFKLLNKGMPSTDENLEDAIKGEHYEWTEMYREFADTAREEGFGDIAFLFDNVADIEHTHEQRYSVLKEKVEANTVFDSDDEETLWICRNCGHVHKGKTPPYVCPVCSKERAFFQIKCENY